MSEWAQQSRIPISGPSVASFPEQQTLGKQQGKANAFAFTTLHRVLIRTILAIHVAIARPPLGDTVPVVTLEVGGLAGVVDGCRQKEREKLSMLPSPPLPHQPPKGRLKRHHPGS